MHTNTYLRRLALMAFLTGTTTLSVSAQRFVFSDSDSQPLSVTTETGITSETGNSSEALLGIVRDIRDSENISVSPLLLSRTEWKSYGTRLESALASGHQGLQRAALRLIIAYGDRFSLSDRAVFDVMRLYRDDDSERVRRMAVVTLGQMNSKWAMNFLARSVRFEKSGIVKKTILAVLNAGDYRPL